jgi:hypothetical protein
MHEKARALWLSWAERHPVCETGFSALVLDQFLRKFGENRGSCGENGGVSSRRLGLKIRVSGVQFPPWPLFLMKSISYKAAGFFKITPTLRRKVRVSRSTVDNSLVRFRHCAKCTI